MTTGMWLGGLLVLVMVLILMDRVAVHMIRPRLKPLRRRAVDLPFPSEPVAIPSGDQVLSGWIVRPLVDHGGPVAVLVHGWGSNHGTMTRLGQPLLEAGFPILAFDVRHHGESQGAPYVTARHFRDDISAAIQAAEAAFPDRPRALVGHSMGGATGVLSVANGAPVSGLVVIGAPADMWGIWAYYLNRKKLPGGLIVKLFKPFWRVRAGVPWSQLDPIRQARNLSVPLLILHGEDDKSVPPFHARLLGESAGVIPRILTGEEHTDLLESDAVVDAVVEFLNEIPARA